MLTTKQLIEDKHDPQTPNHVVRISEICPRLYISDYTCATNSELLIKHGIKAVLRINEFPLNKQGEQVYAQLGITYLHLKIEDSGEANIASHFEASYVFLDKYYRRRKLPTIVH